MTPPAPEWLQGVAGKRREANTTNIEAKIGSNVLNSVGLVQALMRRQKNHHPNG
tara:strand:+ start:506 stop:667 length:162 start_codon:yes stop_codon:yes gene_type:complete